MNKTVKYSLRILGGIIVGIMLLLLLVSLLIQTRPVKNRIAKIAEKQSSRFINGNLSIGKISGNFFTGIELEDILLTYEQDTVVYISELNVNYNLWPLMNKKIEINSAEMIEPYFYLQQSIDSTWNLQKIIKPVNPKKDTVKKSGGINLVLSDVSVLQGTINIEAIDTIIPQKINNWTTRLSFRLAENVMNVNVNKFELSTIHPDFTLNQLQFEFEKNISYFTLSNFRLKTAKNSIEGNAELETAKPVKGSADLETSEVQLNEFEYFIPNLKIPAKPITKINVSLNSDSVHVFISLNENEQSIYLDLKSSNLADYLFNKAGIALNYELNGEFNNVELGHWIGNPKLNYFINGNLTAAGNGIKPAEAGLTVNANFNESIVEEKRFKKLLVDLELRQGNLSGIVHGNSEFGWFRAEPKIENIFKHPVYNATLETRNLNLASMLGNDSLSSNLNLTAKIKGSEFKPEKISAGGKVILSDSKFQRIELDTVVANAKFENFNVQIDSLWMRTENTSLEASGIYNLKGNSDIQLKADFKNVAELRLYVPLNELETGGNLNAHVTGKPDSLTLDADLNLEETRYQDITLQELQLNAKGHIAVSDTTFSTRLKAYNFIAGKLVLDSISAQVEGSIDSLFTSVRLSNKDFNTMLQTGFVPGETLKFNLNDWQINYKDQQWQLQQSPAIVKIDSVNYSVENFRIGTQDDADSVMFISAEGRLSRKGEEDLNVKVSGIRLNDLFETLEKEVDATGTLDIKLDLEGTALSPGVKGDIILSNAAFNDYVFTDFNGKINYSNRQLDFTTYIVSEDSGKVLIDATVPLQLNLDTMGYYINPKDSIRGKAVIDSFPLAILRILDITGNISGYLEGNVDLQGTVEAPDPHGEIRLVDASVNIDEYGIEYEDIKLNLNFLKNSVRLDTLLILSDDGKLTGGGKIDFGSGFYKGDISQSEIQLNFDKFNLLNHNQLNMQVSGKTSIGGDNSNVVFDGELEIPQAEIYLPALLSMMGKMSAPEIPKPILVRQAELMDVSFDSLGIKTFEATKPDSLQFTYFDRLEGRLRIKIPKNTWIKNEDMRIEISGDLELKKNRDFFELFGSVEVVRGQYDLLGKTFIIKEGTISFQGGEEILPRLNINASYSFRNRGSATQKLVVQISGTPESPEINFLLDGSLISEGDALSYILFGKAMNELTISEQQNVEGAGGGSLAREAAASILSSQITNFLGDKLNVDYIEVKGDGNFDKASVVVGKYITNDLFVSYEQRFGETDEKNVAKYEVKLEYELFRFLFFELNNSSNDSGFDVIIKFDVE